MIRAPIPDDDWLGTFPNPLVPHGVRRRRMLRRALWVALVLAAAAGLYMGAPFVGMAAVAMLGVR